MVGHWPTIQMCVSKLACCCFALLINVVNVCMLRCNNLLPTAYSIDVIASTSESFPDKKKHSRNYKANFKII